MSTNVFGARAIESLSELLRVKRQSVSKLHAAQIPEDLPPWSAERAGLRLRRGPGVDDSSDMCRLVGWLVGRQM